MRLLLASFLGAALLAVSNAAPVPKDAAQPKPFIATQKGAKWVYGTDTTKLAQRITYIVTAVEDKDGDKIVTVSEEAGISKRLYPHIKVVVSESGLFLVEDQEIELDPPLCLLKFPVKSGEQWDFNDINAKKNKDLVFYPKGTVFVHGSEEVRVQAGTFQAVKVETVFAAQKGGQASSVTRWYAEGIGEVKVVADNRTMLLESFTPGPAKP